MPSGLKTGLSPEDLKQACCAMKQYTHVLLARCDFIFGTQSTFRRRNRFMDITQGTQDVGGSGNYRSSPGDACVTPQPIAAVRRLSVQLPFPVMTETRCSNIRMALAPDTQEKPAVRAADM